MSPSMHPDELHSDSELVRHLLREQFPEYADLAITRFDSTGTENAIYRLGESLSVRLPLTRKPPDQREKEHRWLPSLAASLSLPITTPVALGQPDPRYPTHWSIYTWIDGENPSLARLADACEEAIRLASFIKSLRAISPDQGPPPGPHNFWRGVPLAARDAQTRRAIEQAAHLVDAHRVTSVWERDARAAAWDQTPVWIHGDLSAGNMLARSGRICAIIDWGGLGVGDPATDLLLAWNFFDGESREVFRRAVDVDEDTWRRGRALALSIGLVALPYYQESNPAMATWAASMIDAVLDDQKNL